MAISFLPGKYTKPVGTKLSENHPISKGLLGYWLYNEVGGKTAFDLSRYSHHKTVTGNGVRVNTTQGLAFDSSDGASKSVATFPWVAGSGVTVAYWFQNTAYLQGNAYRYAATLNGSGGGNEWLLGYNYFLANSYTFYSASGAQLDIATLTANDSKPHHLVISLGYPSATTLKVYYDGVLKNSGTLSYAPSGSGTWDVGGSYTYHKAQWTSEMIFNRGLSGAEVLELYNNPWCLLDEEEFLDSRATPAAAAAATGGNLLLLGVG